MRSSAFRKEKEVGLMVTALILALTAPVAGAVTVFGPGAAWVSSVTTGSYNVSLGASLVLVDPGLGSTSILLSGPGVVAHGAAYPDPGGSGNHQFDTEIVSMSLSGVDPLYGSVNLSRAMRSVGLVQEQSPGALLADAFFDGYFELYVGSTGTVLLNFAPINLAVVGIRQWPPVGPEFEAQMGDAFIEWFDDKGQPTGFTTPQLALKITGVVPVPPSVLLFVSGLVGLGTLTRSRMAALRA